MSDSIPSATADPEQEQLPANAEDRKAAAALSALNTNGISAETGPKPPSAADQEALDKAMSRLEIAAGQDAGKKRTASETAQGKEGEVVRKKAVRVAADDVALLVCLISVSLMSWG